MTPLDEKIAALTAQLLPLLRERSIRHTSFFTDDGEPRIYLSHGPYRSKVEGDGRSMAEALAALDAAIGDARILETLY
jgi:hypothetical protein